MSTIGVSIMSVTLITLNRYLAIIYKTNITRFQAQVMIAAAWVIIPSLFTLFGTNENIVALQPSYTYCLLDYTQRDDGIVTSLLVTILVFLSAPLVFLIIAYSQIILYYRKMNRRKKKVNLAVRNHSISAQQS